MKGFAHQGYASSLAEFGTPRQLPSCGGWILERRIRETAERDGMGCYPLFACQDWSRLAEDLTILEGDLVSLAVVTDPFGSYTMESLLKCFGLVVPFKDHYVADLNEPLEAIVSAHHRQYSRKALKNVTIDVCEEPVRYVNEWTELYGALVKRFNVTGIAAFSPAAFRKQLNIPGTVMFRALYKGTAVGAHVVYSDSEVCYGHLSGITPVGQKLMASYALYWTEIEYFLGKARWLDWGGTAGLKNDGTDGLSQFKQGWSTDTRTAYFCGRIFNRQRYDEITRLSGAADTSYFPAYRMGEFE